MGRQDESIQVKQASQVPVATPHAETAEPAENSPVPQTACQLESSATQPAPTDERQTSAMQVDRREEATGAAVAPAGRSQVWVAKPHAKTASGAPRPTLPPPSGPQLANLLPCLMRTTVTRPSASVAAPARLRVSGVWWVRWGVLDQARPYSLSTRGLPSGLLPRLHRTSNPTGHNAFYWRAL